jgi:hypothetical protein
MADNTLSIDHSPCRLNRPLQIRREEVSDKADGSRPRSEVCTEPPGLKHAVGGEGRVAGSCAGLVSYCCVGLRLRVTWRRGEPY